MKTVQDKDGNIIEVEDDTPCHAGKNGKPPVMLDSTLDADIFAEMAAREAAHLERAPEREVEAVIAARKEAYGSIEGQLDMWYWDQVRGTQELVDHITAVKSRYPKT